MVADPDTGILYWGHPGAVNMSRSMAKPTKLFSQNRFTVLAYLSPTLSPIVGYLGIKPLRCTKRAVRDTPAMDFISKRKSGMAGAKLC